MSACLIAAFGLAQAHADTRCVQSFLAETAFDPGPVDGLWGRKTAGALEAAFSQLEREIDGGVTRNNTDAICALFSGPEGEDIAAGLSLRRYAIDIDPGVIASFDPMAFDFDTVEVATDINAECEVSIERHRYTAPDEPNVMARGTANIRNGILEFDASRWYVGGFARDEDLLEFSNLALTTGGGLAGRMIYYTHVINPGEVFLPPVYVTLGERFESTAGSPLDGKTFFLVNSWSEGSVALTCGLTSLEARNVSLSERFADSRFTEYRMMISGLSFGDLVAPSMLTGSLFVDYDRSAKDPGDVNFLRFFFYRHSLSDPESREANYLDCPDTVAREQRGDQRLALAFLGDFDGNGCILDKMGPNDRAFYSALVRDFPSILAEHGDGNASEHLVAALNRR